MPDENYKGHTIRKVVVETEPTALYGGKEKKPDGPPAQYVSYEILDDKSEVVGKAISDEAARAKIDAMSAPRAAK